MKCPNKKFIHLFVDGELSPDTKEYLHIKKCEHCMNEVRFYQEIASNIKRNVRKPASGLIEQIKAKVSRKINTIKFDETANHVLEDNELETLAAAKKEEYIKREDKDKKK